MTVEGLRPIQDLDGQIFDVVVIGAGINGASAAQHLAGGGYRVLLVDRGDVASGSSGRSTRVMHCGLRYFESPSPMREFALHPSRLAQAVAMARSAMRTRSRLCRDAPQRLQPFRMLFPVFRDGPYRRWQVDLAFAVLTRLDDLREPLEYQRLTPQRASNLPFARDLASLEAIDSVASFKEFMFDWPERFAIDMALDAQRLGAVIRTYTEASLLHHDGEHWQVQLTDNLSTGQSVRVRTQFVANMAGIWIDQVNASATRMPQLVLATKGSHLAVRLPPEYVDYGISTLNSESEPHYVVPGRGGLHHIGPTETIYDGDLDDIRVTATEMDFLLEETARLLPGLGIGRADVVFTWAGVRPLTYDAATPKGSRTRVLHQLDNHGLTNVFAMTAGPIMGHRSAGEEVLRHVGERAAPTHPKQPLSFSPRLSPDNQNAHRLVGANDATTEADLVRAIEREHARTLEDLLLRRTGLVWTGLIDKAVVERATHTAARALGWSPEQSASAIDRFLRTHQHHYGVPERD